ncbi:hypothetical protein AJ80_05745 [Polytolypa hystricis UAMH7299]|uniref:Uncharacterized protein n=1 Tax=Polytolypa hystricis (strain UAMH7299) TaxID=1447883 RepID=A0A2B7Y244_POLH7|nr:hypothetical protein AJ80_05745 [Polytolypa hystricis UAMH7299]
MPPLAGFSDNPFRTRDDITSAIHALLGALKPYISPGKARIRLPVSTAAHFDEAAAQLEGYARPLWAVATLLASDGARDHETLQFTQPWVDGIVNGTDPSHPEFWGEIGDMDQRIVEAEIIAYALLTTPDRFYHSLPATARGNVMVWLRGMNGKAMSATNWRWLRVMSNLALVKVCGVPYEEVKGEMQADLHLVDSFYVGEGWSADGPWRTREEEEHEETEFKNSMDNLDAGMGGLLFSQLLYVMHAVDIDAERVELYKQRARYFGTEFWRYFDEDGAAIPFGVVKGLLLRHLRWWAAHSDDIFYPDGAMNIGYLYPNMYMSEDYNSPQSVYWCLKTLVIAALPETDEFWACEELPQPLSPSSTTSPISGVHLLKPPAKILCNHPQGNHHFLLSASQFCSWALKASEAKYTKFAYSSTFGFSVPTGPLIRRDFGETWKLKWKPAGGAKFGVLKVPASSMGIFPTQGAEDVPILSVGWKPWLDSWSVVETTLIPPTNRGFAIAGQRSSDGGVLPRLGAELFSSLRDTVGTTAVDTFSEGIFESADEALVLSHGAASGVVNIRSSVSEDGRADGRLVSSGSILRPDANTNLMCQRTLIPTIKHAWRKGQSDVLVLVSAVFAITGSSGGTRSDGGGRGVRERWLDRPVVKVDNDGTIVLG